MRIEALPPIEINGHNSVVGLNYDRKTGSIKIFHHFRTIEDNKEYGAKHVEVDYRHIPMLVARLSATYANHVKTLTTNED